MQRSTTCARKGSPSGGQRPPERASEPQRTRGVRRPQADAALPNHPSVVVPVAAVKAVVVTVVLPTMLDVAVTFTVLDIPAVVPCVTVVIPPPIAGLPSIAGARSGNDFDPVRRRRYLNVELDARRL